MHYISGADFETKLLIFDLKKHSKFNLKQLITLSTCSQFLEDFVIEF